MAAAPPLPPDEPDPLLGRVVRRLREEKGLSQAELAERAEVPVSTLSRIERAEIDPSWATVEKIAKGLHVSMKEVARLVAEQERTEESF